MTKAVGQPGGSGPGGSVTIAALAGRPRSFRGLVPAAALLLAGCGGTPVAVSEMSAALSSELAATSADAGTPVDLGGGFKPAVARAVAANAGYRAALALEPAASSRVGVAESARRPHSTARMRPWALCADSGRAGI